MSTKTRTHETIDHNGAEYWDMDAVQDRCFVRRTYSPGTVLAIFDRSRYDVTGAVKSYSREVMPWDDAVTAYGGRHFHRFVVVACSGGVSFLKRD